MIPCKTCISYAICKQKSTILSCSLLSNFIYNYFPEEIRSKKPFNNSTLRIELCRLFPYAMYISNCKRPTCAWWLDYA